MILTPTIIISFVFWWIVQKHTASVPLAPAKTQCFGQSSAILKILPLRLETDFWTPAKFLLNFLKLTFFELKFIFHRLWLKQHLSYLASFDLSHQPQNVCTKTFISSHKPYPAFGFGVDRIPPDFIKPFALWTM